MAGVGSSVGRVGRGQVQPFEGSETLVDLPEGDLDVAEAVVQAAHVVSHLAHVRPEFGVVASGTGDLHAQGDNRRDDSPGDPLCVSAEHVGRVPQPGKTVTVKADYRGFSTSPPSHLRSGLTAEAAVAVLPVNDPPEAVDDAAETAEDTSVTVDGSARAAPVTRLRRCRRQVGDLRREPRVEIRDFGPWLASDSRSVSFFSAASSSRFVELVADHHAASPTVTLTRLPNRSKARSIAADLVAWSGFSMRRTSLSATSRSRARRRCDTPALRNAS